MQYTANKKSPLKMLIGLLFLYLLLKIIFSIISIELFLQNVPEEAKLSARITAIFSTVFSALYGWLLLIALFLFVWYASKLCFENLAIEQIIAGFQVTIIVLIATQVLKFGFVWLFLIDEIPFIDLASKNIIDQIENTNYHVFSQYADYASVAASGIFFCVELEQKLMPKLVISVLFMASFLIITFL